MSEWTWVYNFRRRVQEAGDTDRIELDRLANRAIGLRRADPDRALALLREARALAERLGEPWWVLFGDHWQAQVLLYGRHDYNLAREVVMRAVVEARKPMYAQLPQRICLHEDLIRIYVGTDPVGHAALIQKAIDYMATEITPDLRCCLCLQGLRTEVELALDRLEAATAAAMHYLAMSTSSAHYAAHAYALLCEIAYRRGDWQAVLEWAEAGEAAARRTPTSGVLPECLAWQAAAARHLGRRRDARRVYRSATSQAAHVGATPSTAYFDALCAYHETGGRLDLALQIRDRQLAAMVGKGQMADECRCRLERCRLLAALGRPLETDLAAAREAACKLVDPAPVLEKLGRIEQGDVR